jgi:hypothetical protein
MHGLFLLEKILGDFACMASFPHAGLPVRLPMSMVRPFWQAPSAAVLKALPEALSVANMPAGRYFVKDSVRID